MQHSPSCDFLNEAHHLTSQIDIINGRALELDNLVGYVQAWIDVFRADVVFADGRIGEIKCSIATDLRRRVKFHCTNFGKRRCNY